jgi:hypothetical protein
MNTGGVLKTLRPGDAGTDRFVEKFGNRLVAVRYRGEPVRRVRSTTVEIVVDEGFWMPHHRSLDDMLRCLNVDMQVNT